MVTPAKIAQTKWELWGCGDSITTLPGDPMLGAYDPGPKERNMFLFIHLAAGILWESMAGHLDPPQELDQLQIYRHSRDIRYRQYLQVMGCLPALGGTVRVRTVGPRRTARPCTRPGRRKSRPRPSINHMLLPRGDGQTQHGHCQSDSLVEIHGAPRRVQNCNLAGGRASYRIGGI